jgi:hypothetical protein
MTAVYGDYFGQPHLSTCLGCFKKFSTQDIESLVGHNGKAPKDPDLFNECVLHKECLRELVQKGFSTCPGCDVTTDSSSVFSWPDRSVRLLKSIITDTGIGFTPYLMALGLVAPSLESITGSSILMPIAGLVATLSVIKSETAEVEEAEITAASITTGVVAVKAEVGDGRIFAGSEAVINVFGNREPSESSEEIANAIAKTAKFSILNIAETIEGLTELPEEQMPKQEAEVKTVLQEVGIMALARKIEVDVRTEIETIAQTALLKGILKMGLGLAAIAGAGAVQAAGAELIAATLLGAGTAIAATGTAGALVGTIKLVGNSGLLIILTGAVTPLIAATIQAIFTEEITMKSIHDRTDKNTLGPIAVGTTAITCAITGQLVRKGYIRL